MRSILRCIDQSFPSSLCLLSMQIVERLCANYEFQEMYFFFLSFSLGNIINFTYSIRLFKCGAHFFLLPLILQPVINITKSNAHDPLATYLFFLSLLYQVSLITLRYAWSTLAHLAGFVFFFSLFLLCFLHDILLGVLPNSPSNPTIKTTLTKILTPGKALFYNFSLSYRLYSDI